MDQIIRVFDIQTEHLPNIVFNEECRLFSYAPDHNKLILRDIERWANDKLDVQGHLFLNEVYDILGAPRTRSGQITGWIDGEGRVVFNIAPTSGSKIGTGVEYFSVMFNVQGYILDKI